MVWEAIRVSLYFMVQVTYMWKGAYFRVMEVNSEILPYLKESECPNFAIVNELKVQ